MPELKRGKRMCECPTCGLFFQSVSAFDQHRTGDWDHRRCLTPAEMTAKGMCQDEAGYWLTATKRKVPVNA